MADKTTQQPQVYGGSSYERVQEAIKQGSPTAVSYSNPSVGGTSTEKMFNAVKTGAQDTEAVAAAASKYPQAAPMGAEEQEILAEFFDDGKKILNIKEQRERNNKQELKDKGYSGVAGFGKRFVDGVFFGENVKVDDPLTFALGDYLKQGHTAELEFMESVLESEDIKKININVLTHLGSRKGLKEEDVKLLFSSKFFNALKTIINQNHTGVFMADKNTQTKGTTYGDITGNEQWRETGWDAKHAGQQFASYGLELLGRSDKISRLLEKQSPDASERVDPADFEGKLKIVEDPIDGNPVLRTLEGGAVKIPFNDQENLMGLVKDYNAIKAVYDKMNNVVSTMDNPQSEQDFLKGFLEKGKTYLTQDELNAINNRIIQLNTVVAQYSTDGVADTIAKKTSGDNN
mgnify:FL=1